MQRVNVTVISCIYGDSHDRFVAEWTAGIRLLDPQPETVLVSTDHPRAIRVARVFQTSRIGTHKQALHLQAALDRVKTEWVWIHDIDDVAFHDALRGIDDIRADVWQLGYARSDGVTYLPPQLTAAEVLAAKRNPFVAGSCIRTEALRAAGGFPDLALQDWALWRELARVGVSFKSSNRVHFHYRRHSAARGLRELTADRRVVDVAEMHEWEEARALTV